MLLGIVGLFESKKRFEMFRDNEFEIMYFNKRVAYFKDYNEQKPSLNPPFSSVYICHNMLPKKIMFKEIDKKIIKERKYPLFYFTINNFSVLGLPFPLLSNIVLTSFFQMHVKSLGIEYSLIKTILFLACSKHHL